MSFSLNNSNAFYCISFPLTGYPFSFAGWFRVPATPAMTYLMGVASLATGARCDLLYAGNGSKEAIARTMFGSSGSAYSTSPMVESQWHHLAAVFASDSDRKVYLDGGNVGTNNVSLAIGPLDFCYFGNGYSTTTVDVGEISLVGAALSSEEVLALSRGVSILALADSSQLITYHDCIRSAMRPRLGPDFFSSGSLVVKDHPRATYANGGTPVAMPNRIRGPFRIEEALARASSDAAGQCAIAGSYAANSFLPGEVVSQ
ncbi:MAG: hypothetical protein KDA57_00995 [Planctomycetales bacterium]|nr:hypothetical protein [Planctomycetales bacterium]